MSQRIIRMYSQNQREYEDIAQPLSNEILKSYLGWSLASVTLGPVQLVYDADGAHKNLPLCLKVGDTPIYGKALMGLKNENGLQPVPVEVAEMFADKIEFCGRV